MIQKLQELPGLKVEHIGIIVKDIEKAVKYYESQGFGPFEDRTGGFTAKRLRGNWVDPDSITLIEKHCYIGSLRFSLIQPMKGWSIWKEFLETNGEGVHHVAFSIDDCSDEDFDRWIAELEKSGLEIPYISKHESGGQTTYFNTAKSAGVNFEIIRRKP